MAKLNIKKGDTVLVLAGKENGKTSTVLECFPEENKVTVKGINIIVKHNKPRSAQDKGGIVKKEGKFDASNVMVVCPVCNKATKIKMGKNDKDEKVRICKKCGAILDGGAKAPAAKKATTKSAEVKAEEKPAKKPAAKKTTAKKAVEAKTEEKKAPAKATAAKKAPAKATAAKKAPAKKAAAKSEK